LFETLDGLKPSKRVVFVLCDLQGYTLKEAGTIVGARLATVAARLRAARLEVRRSLKRRLARDARASLAQRVS
jgi:DNA-directed RNA polymerase specialized sigma24 family protein